ncbi:hypothetical protein VTN00DRAFT_2011 [Thermoascus crustaceus]|uniref:uncharacterized protein n=1 Tax=Thermoascus crustaceus TaxID=5088 RepID=UPI0037420695
MSAASETGPDPPWGQMALDLYLLEQWDHNSSEVPAEQRKRLASAYVQLGWPGRKKYHQQIKRKEFTQPSDAAIESVLKPFRTPHQRHIAHYPGHVGCVWLRTAYGPGTDALHEERTDFIDWDMAIDDEDHLLNDRELYGFGTNWQDVFLVLPELLDVHHGHDESDEYYFGYQRYKIAHREHSPDTLELLDGEEDPQERFRLEHHRIHRDYVANFVIVEDEEALRNGNVLLNFVDSQGQVVRQKRTNFDEAQMIGGMALEAAWDDMDAWRSGTVGERYREGGERGPPYDVD